MSWTALTQHPDFPLWILLLGLALSALAAILTWRKIRFFRHSQVAPAQNVTFDKRSALEGNLWQTTVEFTDDQGIKHRLGYTGSGPYPPFAKAKNLKIYYDAQNPRKAYAYNFWKVWTPELAIASLSLFITVVGIAQQFFTVDSL